MRYRRKRKNIKNKKGIYTIMTIAYYAQVRTDGSIDPRVENHALCNKEITDVYGNIVSKVFPLGSEGTFILPIVCTPDAASFVVTAPASVQEFLDFYRTQKRDDNSRNYDYYDIVKDAVDPESTPQQRTQAWEKLPFLCPVGAEGNFKIPLSRDKEITEENKERYLHDIALVQIDSAKRNKYSAGSGFILDHDGQLYRRVTHLKVPFRVNDPDTDKWNDERMLTTHVSPYLLQGVEEPYRAFMRYSPQSTKALEERIAQGLCTSLSLIQNLDNHTYNGDNFVFDVPSCTYHNQAPAFFRYMHEVMSALHAHVHSGKCGDKVRFEYDGEFDVDPLLWEYGFSSKDEQAEFFNNTHKICMRLNRIIGRGEKFSLRELLGMNNNNSITLSIQDMANSNTYEFAIPTIPKELENFVAFLLRRKPELSLRYGQYGLCTVQDEDIYDPDNTHGEIRLHDLATRAIGHIFETCQHVYKVQEMSYAADMVKSYELCNPPGKNDTLYTTFARYMVYTMMSSHNKGGKSSGTISAEKYRDTVATLLKSESAQFFIPFCIERGVFSISLLFYLLQLAPFFSHMDTLHTYCAQGNNVYSARILDTIVAYLITEEVHDVNEDYIDFHPERGNKNNSALSVNNISNANALIYVLYDYIKYKDKSQKVVEEVLKTALLAYSAHTALSSQELSNTPRNASLLKTVSRALLDDHVRKDTLVLLDKLDINYLLILAGFPVVEKGDALENTNRHDKGYILRPNPESVVEKNSQFSHILSILSAFRPTQRVYICCYNKQEQQILESNTPHIPFTRNTADPVGAFINLCLDTGAFKIKKSTVQLPSRFAYNCSHIYAINHLFDVDNDHEIQHSMCLLTSDKDNTAYIAPALLTHPKVNPEGSLEVYELQLPHSTYYRQQEENGAQVSDPDNPPAVMYVTPLILFALLRELNGNEVDNANIVDSELWDAVISSSFARDTSQSSMYAHVRAWIRKTQRSAIGENKFDSARLINLYLCIHMLIAIQENNVDNAIRLASIPVDKYFVANPDNCGAKFFEAITQFPKTDVPTELIVNLLEKD